MINVVLDSDVIIDHTRNASNFLDQLLAKVAAKKVTVYTPSIVVVELMSGQETRSLVKLEKLEVLIEKTKFIPLDFELSRLAGFIIRDSKGSIRSGDAVVAATAISLNAKLATRNKKHFEGIKNLKFFKAS